MKKRITECVLCFLVLLLIGLARSEAQFIGYVSPQTVQQTLATGQLCTGSQQLFNINNIGQTQHYLQISSVVGATQFTAQLLGFDTQGNSYAISDPLFTSAGTNITVEGSGYYPKIQVAITCSPNTGTYNASYSGAWGTFGATVGANLIAQIDKLLFNGTAENLTQSSQFNTPFGTSAGQLFVRYSVAGAGGSISVGCIGQQLAQTVETFPLANVSTKQVFNVADSPCVQLLVNYTNNGQTGTIVVEYQFSQPGRVNGNLNANLYANITSNASTQVKSVAGFLHSIVINAPGSSETLTLFDNTSCAGTKIGTVTVAAAQPLLYDVQFLTGLCITSAGTTAGDYTVSYQ